MSSPVVRIARKEFLEMVRDGRVRWAAVVVGVLLSVSVVAGWQHAASIAAEHDRAQQATRAQWERQPAKNPHSAAHYGIFAFKPQSPLAMIDTGIDPYVGVAAWLEAHRQNDFKYRPAADRTALQRFGDFTPAMVMQVLLPLVIVLLAFGTVAAEREQGTWRQLLSTGVSPGHAVLGKALGVAAVLGVIVVPAALLAAGALGSSAPSRVFDADWSRAVPLAAVYIVWCLIWLGVTLAVSLLARSSRSALVTLLGLWMVTSLVAPRLVSDVAGVRHPTPTAAEFQRALDADLSDSATRNARLEAKRQALFAQYQVTTVEALPINFSGVSLQEGEEHANVVFDTHFGRLFDTFERQNAVARAAAFVAPLLAVRSVSMALAGSDFSQHRHFVTAAESYRRDLQRRLNGEVALHQKPGATYLAGPELWESIPDFTYTAPDVSSVLRTVTTPLLALLMWTLLVGGLVIVASTRVRA
jgi:ABC-2 type transport system permease protein